MKGIFKDAKFGDKFLTRDGNVAIYHYYNGDIMAQHHLILEDGWGVFCHNDGIDIGRNDDRDIVAKL